MSIQDHPGFFGITSQGVIAIHADWPMYPEEHGAELALLWLTAFPQGTAFKEIDDIDRCILFLADIKGSQRSEPFSERNFHIAIWHDDLLELHKRQLIEGVSFITERRWIEEWRADLPPGLLFRELDDGTMRKVHLPPLDEFDDEPSWRKSFPNGITVNSVGRATATSVLAEATTEPTLLGERVRRLQELEFFDASVREACVGLEHQIKTCLGSDSWGDVLVEEFISRLRGDAKLLESYLRVLRAQLRTAFKFIRNDFMHNFVDIDQTQCNAILFRLEKVASEVKLVIAALSA